MLRVDVSRIKVPIIAAASLAMLLLVVNIALAMLLLTTVPSVAGVRPRLPEAWRRNFQLTVPLGLLHTYNKYTTAITSGSVILSGMS